MRCSFALCLATAVLVASSAGGQEKPKEMKERLKVEGVRVGLPDGRTPDQGRYKAGFWTPIYVDVQVGPQDIQANELVLIVETADNDGILNQYKETVPFSLPKRTITGLMTYVRPGNSFSDTTVTVALGERTIRHNGFRRIPESWRTAGFYGCHSARNCPVYGALYVHGRIHRKARRKLVSSMMT